MWDSDDMDMWYSDNMLEDEVPLFGPCPAHFGGEPDDWIWGG